MRVKELQAKLDTFDGDLPIRIRDDETQTISLLDDVEWNYDGVCTLVAFVEK